MQAERAVNCDSEGLVSSTPQDTRHILFPESETAFDRETEGQEKATKWLGRKPPFRNPPNSNRGKGTEGNSHIIYHEVILGLWFRECSPVTYETLASQPSTKKGWGGCWLER